MSPELHARIKSVFFKALEQPEAQRDAFLVRECGRDPLVFQNVQELLDLHLAKGDFLTTPMPELLGAKLPVRRQLAVGELLKRRYRIEDKIAESGFATVYLASDITLAGKQIVIKLLDGIYSDRLQATLELELGALARLQHPNIVGISDVGQTADETPFLVLTYVPGRTLREVLRSGALPIERTRSILAGVGKALSAAHRAGVCHLDLKPENIILSDEQTDDERVTIIDFGIARLRELPNSPLSAGSPNYMAPEQPGEASTQSDIYALGKVAFELLTGHLPDQNKALEDQLPRAAAGRTARAIARAIEVSPQSRPASVVEFLDEIELRSKPSTQMLVAGGLGVVLVGAITLWSLASPSDPTLVSPVPLVTTPGFEYQPAFSTDGKWVYYAAGIEGRLNIYRKEVVGGEPVLLVDHPNNDFRPQPSPDGKSIAFIRDYPSEGALIIKPLDPLGNEREVARWTEFDSFTWFPDGSAILVSEDYEPTVTRRLRRIDLQTGGRRDIVGIPTGTAGDMRPAFSPDGTRLAFVRRWDQGSSDIFIVDLDAGFMPRTSPHQLTRDRDRIESIQWTPDGRDLLFVAGPLLHGSLWRVSASGGEPKPMLIGAGRIESIAVPRRDWKIAYGMLLSDTNIWRLKLDADLSHASSPELIVAGTYEDREPHLSPDEKVLAFVSARSGEEQVWVSKPNGTNPRKLTSFENPDSMDVTWMPDSSAVLVSVRSRKLGRRVYRISLDSPPTSMEVLNDALASSVSRDGRWLYFCRRVDRVWQLWRADLANPNNIDRLTEDGGYFGLEDPEGKTLFFTKQNENDGIWRKTLPREPASRLSELPYRRNLFIPLRRGLLYIAKGPGADQQSLYFKPNDEASRLLHTFDREVFWGVNLSRDEQNLLFSQFDVSNSDIMLVPSFR